MRTEPYLADALKDPRKRTKCPKKREVIPEAHLPIRGPIDFSNSRCQPQVSNLAYSPQPSHTYIMLILACTQQCIEPSVNNTKVVLKRI